MWAAEVAADEVWPALASVEEPAGLGGELGPIAGPGRAPEGSVAYEPVQEAAHDVGVETSDGTLSGE